MGRRLKYPKDQIDNAIKDYLLGIDQDTLYKKYAIPMATIKTYASVKNRGREINNIDLESNAITIICASLDRIADDGKERILRYITERYCKKQ